MTSTPPRHLRTDIQALRGFAVLVVLFFHAKISLFTAGYLGVDLFFVISGFLITRLVKEEIESGNFRFSDFYFRRAKRLLPAAYVTFIATAMLSPLFLTSLEMLDFRTQMIGAVTFTANIVLWQQSGYFGGAAELKPLLHVWSLAIEEQYYFILPAMMVFVQRRYWLRIAIAVLLASLFMCFARSGSDSTFYLLPTRAWELMIGSVGVLIRPGERFGRLVRIAFWPAIGMLIVLPTVKLSSFHPGPEALTICLATLVLILRQHPMLLKGIAVQLLSKVGDISYSLYLVHWPLFAFLNNAWIEESGDTAPLELRIGLIALSLVMAYLLHRYVEEPARHMTVRGTVQILARTVAISFSLILITSGIVHATADTRDYVHVRRVNYGMGQACDFKENFVPLPECRNGDNPKVMVWGDSYAMHLVPGLLANSAEVLPMIQATRSACGPLRGISVVEIEKKNGYNEHWAKSCIRYNEAVLAYLAQTNSVETVVLSTLFLPISSKNQFRLLKHDEYNGTYQMIDPTVIETREALKRTIVAIRGLGKRVVLVAPPPASLFNIGRCTERLESGLLMLGVADECRISTDAYRKVRGETLDFLATLPQEASVEVISFDDYLCSSGLCRTYVNNTFIYRDKGHLSHEGSVLLANEVSLVGQIKEKAK